MSKQKISSLISNDNINKMYATLKDDGMIGGKLLGSGGEGFLFGILDKKIDVAKFKNKYKSHYVDCGISKEGSTIINA